MNNKILKILVIDDCKEFNFLLKTILDSAQFEVYTCISGREAIKICSKITPDLVFLDMRIPDITSPQMAAEIHFLCDPTPKIVGLTGHHPDEIAHEIANSDIDICIQKPLELKELKKVLFENIESVAQGLLK